MKKFLSSLIASTFFIAIFSPVFAASSGDPVRLDVSTSPTSTTIGEAIDLTVKALDEDGEVVTDYDGTIYIAVENDTKATTPYADGYEFSEADLGEKTFSKGLSFTKEGKIRVTVIDIDNDSLEGTVEVNVTEGGSTGDTGPTGEITITSPDSGVTISGDSLDVTGTSKKNSLIKFFLNGDELSDLETQTNDDGSFNIKIEGISQETNVLEIKVYDGNDEIVAQSDKINFFIDNSGPKIKSFRVEEGSEAPTGTQINVLLVSDVGLAEATATLGEDVTGLEEVEDSPGSYVGKLTVPDDTGEHPIDVEVKDTLGKTTIQKGIAKIVATQSNIFMNIKAVAGDDRVTFTFEVSPDKEEYKKFRFIYGTSSETLKTAGNTQLKTSTTFEKTEIQEGNAYKWYVPGLDPKYGTYFFKIVPVGEDDKTIEGIESDIQEVAFSLSSAGDSCTISNVSGLTSSTTGDVVELTWDSLPEATSYNVYKKGNNDSFMLIENVPTNRYTINISQDSIKYEDFSIKAVCGDGEVKAESEDYSEATKVQTGPAQLALILSISLIIGFIFVRRRYAK